MDTAQSGGACDPQDLSDRWINRGMGGVAVVLIIIPLMMDLWPSDSLIITEAAALLLFFAGLRQGRAASYRRRVVCLVTVFIGMVLQFSVLHALLAARNPEAFRVADTLLDSRVREELGRDRASILANARLLFAATVLEADAPAVYAALTESPPLQSRGTGWSGTTTRALSGGLTFHSELDVTAQVEGDPGQVEVAYSIRSSTGDFVARFTASTYAPPSIAPENTLAHDLLRARSVADVAKAAREFAGRVQARQTRTVQHMHGIVRREPRLDISHYVYFSATVMTTIGTADLVPATRGARWMVTLQALVAVFFLAFAINFLWPAPGDRAESGK